MTEALKLRWAVEVTNCRTGEKVSIYVAAQGPDSARIAALRVAYVHLNWRKCSACRSADVVHAGLPVKAFGH